MAAIPLGVKPCVKAFERNYLSDLVRDVNDFINNNKNYTFVDITIHPKSVPSGDTAATVIYYVDESKYPLTNATQVLQQ